jgi:hypothetical protein
MPEIVRSMPLTANSVDAETFSQYLEQVADFFNGEPFLFGPTRSVSREASRSLSDESFEAWAFHAFKSEDDDPDPLDAEEEVYTETWGAVDEDGLKDEEQDKVHVNYQIWVAIARPLLDGEYWPDLGEVTKIWKKRKMMTKSPVNIFVKYGNIILHLKTSRYINRLDTNITLMMIVFIVSLLAYHHGRF